MTKATGVVQEIREREARNGGVYEELRLAGQTGSLFDWTECLAAAGVKPGDEVAVEHSGGQYPRVESVTKLNGSGSEGRIDKLLEQVSGSAPSKDVLIVRMNCLRSAIELLAQSDLDYGSKEMSLARLAGSLEDWVRRRDKGPG